MVKESRTGVTINKHNPSFVINGDEIKAIKETNQNPKFLSYLIYFCNFIIINCIFFCFNNIKFIIIIESKINKTSTFMYISGEPSEYSFDSNIHKNTMQRKAAARPLNLKKIEMIKKNV